MRPKGKVLYAGWNPVPEMAGRNLEALRKQRPRRLIVSRSDTGRYRLMLLTNGSVVVRPQRGD